MQNCEFPGYFVSRGPQVRELKAAAQEQLRRRFLSLTSGGRRLDLESGRHDPCRSADLRTCWFLVGCLLDKQTSKQTSKPTTLFLDPQTELKIELLPILLGGYNPCLGWNAIRCVFGDGSPTTSWMVHSRGHSVSHSLYTEHRVIQGALAELRRSCNVLSWQPPPRHLLCSPDRMLCFI